MSVSLPSGATGTPQVPGYRNLLPIGSGAHSTVYLAVPTSAPGGPAAEVAVKVLAGKLASNEAQLNFDREIEAMIGLAGHPNVAELIGSGITTNGRPFLVMPVYPNGTVGSLVESEGPFNWEDLIDFGIKLASAIESVHRSGFVHRDIKPANIFIADNMLDPILADFGVSSFVAPGLDGPATIKVSATPIFAAPEVLNGQRPTTLSDVYALGTVLFGLLEGRPAYAQQSIEQVVRQVTGPEPVPTVTNAPADLRALIARMMAKRPVGRPATALDVARALAAIQRGHGLAVTPIQVLTDGVLGELPAVSASTERKPRSESDSPNRNITEASTLDVEDVRAVRTNADGGADMAEVGQPNQNRLAGKDSGSSLTEQQTVSVNPIDPPTQVMPNQPRDPSASRTVVAAKPGWWMPVGIGLASLAVFVLYWVATGRSLSGGGDSELDSESVALSSALVVAPTMVGEWTAHDDLIGTMAWSADDARLFTAGRDGAGQLWIVDDDGQLTPEASIAADGWILSADWSSDDRLAVGSAEGSVSIWAPDAAAPELEFTVADATIEAVDWEANDDRLVVGGGDGSVTVWEVTSGTAVQQMKLPSRSAAVLSVAWSPTGETIAVGGKDNTVTIWDADSGEQLAALEHDDWVRDLAWSPDGLAVATATASQSLQIWDGQSGEALFDAETDSDPLAGVEWATDGLLVLTGTEQGDLLLWADGAAQPDTVRTSVSPVTAATWSNDALTWAVGRADGSVEIWVVFADS